LLQDTFDQYVAIAGAVGHGENRPRPTLLERVPGVGVRAHAEIEGLSAREGLQMES
jgi:hypothetical protein